MADESTEPATGERADLLQMLQGARRFLRFTTRDLTDEQAGMKTTVSELCVGGLIKHVTRVERTWATFVTEGPDSMPFSEARMADHAASFQMLEGETLAASPSTRRWPRKRTSSSRRCPTLTRRSFCQRRRGSRQVHAGRRGAPFSTSRPRRRNTRVTPTSSARRSTARRQWADWGRDAGTPIKRSGCLVTTLWFKCGSSGGEDCRRRGARRPLAQADVVVLGVGRAAGGAVVMVGQRQGVGVAGVDRRRHRLPTRRCHTRPV